MATKKTKEDEKKTEVTAVAEEQPVIEVAVEATKKDDFGVIPSIAWK